MATTQIKNGFQGGSDDQWYINPTGAGAVFVVNPGGSSAWSNFGQSTPKQVTVTSTNTLLLNDNSLRLFASIANNSSQTIYIQYLNDAEWQKGYRISPGGIWVIDGQGLYTGIVNAITNGSPVDIDVIEGVQ